MYTWDTRVSHSSKFIVPKYVTYYAPFMGVLMVEVWIGTMALQNLQQYGCQTEK
jgi:hypothetical protein